MSSEASIYDVPPPDVQVDLARLASALDASVPPKHLDRNLLIATWNIRSFGSLTRKWLAGDKDSPKRDLRGLAAIKTIVSRFDVIAIQEVVGDLRALRDLIKALGSDWSFLMTDVTRGSSGNNERIAFVFDTRRVQLSGLAAELVVPPEALGAIAPDALQRQFARTPYAVSFRAGAQTFILVSLHVNYGSATAERLPELQAIAAWMAEWATQANRWHHNLIALGDFNIDRRGDALWQAFTSTGLTVPAALNAVPRTIFSDAAAPDTGQYYDQIAWFESGEERRLQMRFVNAGSFDFLPCAYTGLGLSKLAVSFRLSDHYPLWAQFAV